MGPLFGWVLTGTLFLVQFLLTTDVFQFYCSCRQISSILALCYCSGLCLYRRSCYVHVTGFGNLTRLKTRFLYKIIESRPSWDSRFNIGLHNDCLSEIFFWKNNIISLNSRAILPYQAPLLVSYSDASNVACGAFLVGTNEVSHRMWSPCEAAKSSAWRELKAIHFALTSFKP